MELLRACPAGCAAMYLFYLGGCACELSKAPFTWAGYFSAFLLLGAHAGQHAHKNIHAYSRICICIHLHLYICIYIYAHMIWLQGDSSLRGFLNDPARGLCFSFPRLSLAQMWRVHGMLRTPDMMPKSREIRIPCTLQMSCKLS